MGIETAKSVSKALLETKLREAFTNFSVERITADMKRLAPDAAVFLVSAVKGDDIPAAGVAAEVVCHWLCQCLGGRRFGGGLTFHCVASRSTERPVRPFGKVDEALAEPVAHFHSATLPGLSRTEFLAALGQFGVSPFQYTAEEVLEEAARE